MKLILYCNEINRYVAELLARIEASLPGHELVLCWSHRDLLHNLAVLNYDLFAAVIVASGPNDLAELRAAADPTGSPPLVLILPDREKETISRGHELRPRFLSWPEGNMDEIVAVLRKLMKKAENCKFLLKKGDKSHERARGHCKSHPCN